MAVFTQKHYVVIAQAFKENSTKSEILHYLMGYFTGDNPKFKRDVFLNACGEDC